MKLNVFRKVPVFVLLAAVMLLGIWSAQGAVLYFDVNGATAGFGSPSGTYDGANYWNKSYLGTQPQTLYANEYIAFGYSPSDFNGNTFTVDVSAAAIALWGMTFNCTNANITLIGPGANLYCKYGGIFTNAGSTVNFALTPGLNTYNQDVSLVGSGTYNFMTAIGYASATATTVTEDGAGLTVNLYSNAVAGARQDGFTLKQGTLNFAAAGAANAFQQLGTPNSGKLFSLNGGTIDNTSGAPMTLNLGTGSYSIGGNFMFTGSNNLNFGTNVVALGAVASTISVGQNTLTIGGVISGVGYGIVKAGAGTLVLSGTNSYNGDTVISDGKLVLGNAQALQNSAYDTTGSTGDIGLTVTGYATPTFGGLKGSVDLAPAITGYNGVTGLTLNPQSGIAIYSGVIVNGSGNMTLTKTGAGTQILSGTNTYTGTTTVSAGALVPAHVAALPGYNIGAKVVFNGGVLGVQVDGSGWTTAQVDTLLSNASKTSGQLGIDTSNGSLAQWAAFTTANFGSALGLAVLGTNTLTLTTANTYAGSTTVTGGGTLQVGVNNALPIGTVLTLGDATSAGNLSLANFSQSINGLTVVSRLAASTNTITIGAGQTLTNTGNVTVGINVNSTYTSLAMTGSGTFEVNMNGGIFQVGGGTSGSFHNAARLDMSGLGTFTASLGSTGILRVGDTGSGSGWGLSSLPTLILATNSTITAGTITLGPGAEDTTSMLILGNGANVLNANTINCGGLNTSRASATIQFNTTSGILKIRGIGGTDADRAVINMGSGPATGTSFNNTLNLTGHSADLKLDQLAIATFAVGTSTPGNNDNTFTFDTGTLDINSIVMGCLSGSGTALRTVNGVMNLNGGTVIVNNGIMMATNSVTNNVTHIALATLNISSNANVSVSTLSGPAITMAAMALGAGASERATGTVVVAGGSLKVYGNIVDGGNSSAGGVATTTITLNGGALLMPNSAIVNVDNFTMTNAMLAVGVYSSLPVLANRGTGILAPGGTNVVGSTIISNSYVQASTATLDIDLVSRLNYDRVTVTGAVTLAGTINVRSVPAAAGDFDILTSEVSVTDTSTLDAGAIAAGFKKTLVNDKTVRISRYPATFIYFL